MTSRQHPYLLETLLVLLVVTTGYSGACNGVTGQDHIKAKLKTTYDRLPLTFEANQGQTDERVKFLARGPSYGVFLTADEAVLTLTQAPATTRQLKGAQTAHKASGVNTASLRSEAKQPSPKQAVLRMKLVGANLRPQLTGVEKLGARVNYLIGNDPKKWRTNVPTFSRIRVEDVYPGIDLLYYGNQQQLEYDFILAPNARPSDIKLKFYGADRISINPSGDLILHTAVGNIRQPKPIIYQESNGERHAISGGYILQQLNQVAFRVGPYDSEKPLIIDPTLVFFDFLGNRPGEAFTNHTNESGFGIAVDQDNTAFVTGIVNSSSFPTTPDPDETPFQGKIGGESDAFVARVDHGAAGPRLLYSTYVGGRKKDRGLGIAVDQQGSAVVTGATESPDFPITGTFSYKRTHGGNLDAFAVKLNFDGSGLLYSTFLGGQNDDIGYSVAVDSQNSIYVAGVTKSYFQGKDTGATFTPDKRSFPTVNAFQRESINGSLTGDNAFLTKLNSTADGDASLLYSTFFGGPGSEEARGIAVDQQGSAYITGTTNSSGRRDGKPTFPIHPLQAPDRAFSIRHNGMKDVFVAKFDPGQSGAASLVYSTFLGGTEDDEGRGIAVDQQNRAYITGFSPGRKFPNAHEALSNTPHSYRSAPIPNAGVDVFAAKFDAKGSTLLYFTFLGGTLVDRGHAIAVDSQERAYITGLTSSYEKQGTSNRGFPVTNNALQTGSAGNTDAFVSMINTTVSGDPSLVYSSYLGFKNGAAGDEIGNGIAVFVENNASHVYVTGSARASTANTYDSAITAASFDNRYDGADAVFVAKFLLP